MGTKFYKAQNESVYPFSGKFCILLFFFSVSFFSSFSQTNLTFTQLTSDFMAPGKGAQHWGTTNWDDLYAPTIPTGNSIPMNYYTRFNWKDIESSTTQGSYTWTVFDAYVNQAIDNGAMYSFGLMPFCNGCGTYGEIPQYVQTLMANEGKPGWSDGGFMMPNYQSTNWVKRYSALMRAVANHIATTSRNGKSYVSAFLGYDIRHYGNFGEGWGGSTGQVPSGAQVTDAYLMQMTDSAIAIFPNAQLSIPMNYVAPNNDYSNASGNTGTQAAYYVLTASNNYGRIGWRRDNIGDDGYNAYLSGTSASYSGNALQPLIMNMWKFAPLGGEPAIDNPGVSRCGQPYCDVHNEDVLFHMSYFGNGNYPNTQGTSATLFAQQNTNMRASSAFQGYKIQLTGGSMTTNLVSGSNFNITLNWQNIGIAPIYEKWNVTYELRNSGGTVVWTGNSPFQLRLFLPQTTATPQSDNLTLPSTVPAGTYSMYLVIRDPANYKKPLPLAITGRGTDGSYLLRNNIAVTTGTGNQAPSANAGSNQTIQLPTATATLSGSGTDADGTISTYAWTKTSGPTGGAIASPAAASTGISGLIQGVYVYTLTVTDNNGATGTSTVQITVNSATTPPPPPPPPPAFTVNAGPDQTLAAGTTTATLSGTIPASTTGPASDTITLVVIQGESNAAGDGSNSDALASELATRSAVQIFNHNTNKFESIHIGVNNEQDTYIDQTHHGMELGLTNEVEAGNLKNPTYLVDIGVSGSYICQWLPGSTCRGVGQGLWELWVMTYVDKAVNAIKAMGKPYRIVVWQSLGLNDRISQGTQPQTFVTGMQQFMSAFRSRYNDPKIKFLSTNFDNPPGPNLPAGDGMGWDWSYLWDQMAAADPNFKSISVKGATYVDQYSHWNYGGLKLIAHNMVSAMISLGMGASSSGGSGNTYTPTWSKVSGPAAGTIVTPSAAGTNLSGLTAGTYIFRLSVKDNSGTTVTDDVQITVSNAAPPANIPPIAKAGSDMSITMPTSTANVNGSSSTDPDGTISTYQWTKVSGPTQFTIANTAAMTTAVNNMTAGVYSFQLKVTDNAGASSMDTVKVTVNAAVPPPNQPPVAKAGTDLSITMPTNTVNINGSSSTDPDGTISSYQWTKLSGPTSFTIVNGTAVSTAVNNLTAGVYSFQLKVTDNAGASSLDTINVTVNVAVPPPNQPPVAKAGTDMSITMPTNTVNMSASSSTDPDGTISAYQWTKIGGPTQFTIANGSAMTTAVNNLTAGVYSFQLKVTDNAGASSLDTVKVTVNAAVPPPNQPPVAKAGTDLSITMPTNTVNINGSSSTDPDGTISAYQWTKVSGPTSFTIVNGTAVNTTVNNLTAGVYSFQLKVTDNAGASSLDTINVTVNAAVPPPNQSPVAKAGADQTITLPTSSVTINGNSSSDPDGSISAYQWSKLSGPTQFAIGNNTAASTIVNNLTAGVYSFQLKVTDNVGAIALDTIKIIVNAAPVNQPPVANAGSDINITLPTNLANLSGSASTDADGTISVYSWSQVSGPNSSVIGSASSASTGVSGLIQGTYVFTLKVTDNSGATDVDSLKVIVNPAANLPPVAYAGASKTITLPVNSTNLDGSLSSDPDGTIVSFNWIQTSGPSTASLTGANTSSANAGNLVAGIYNFQLTVTDNNGAKSVATIKITVAAAGIQPPIANAGANQTITLPTNNATISGIGSSASSGSIVSYVWTEKSGPSTVSLSNTIQNNLTNLKAGVYIFKLTVTDNNAGTGTDSVKITVNPAANQAPVANAGTGINLTLPNNSTSLSGGASYDPDGTISSYSWTRISGPSNPTATGANTATLNISGLVAGTYNYQLTVTDNSGASSSAQVKVIVTAAANVPPVANAGPNQSITSPASSVILNGSASVDPDGTIASYSWVTISGPGSITINNSNTVTPSVVGLQTGGYVFELTVTDNNGATSKDQISVTVLPPVVLPNQSPVANAGSNLTITLPDNTVDLNGSSSFDPDGTLTAFGWTQISGPSASAISGGNTSAPNVSQLIVGQYVYELTVTDNNGATNTDRITVTVNPGVVKVNLPPVAFAGQSDTILLPTNKYSLNGSQSMDPDGTIQSYKWQEITGPNDVSSYLTNNAQVNLSNLQAGEYEFQLTVTDDAGATSTATMRLTVTQSAFSVTERLSVFPNPAHTVVNQRITSPIDGTVKVDIYDMSGKLVLTRQFEKTTDVVFNKIYVDKLAPGMYTIQVNIANRKTMVSKFIKY